MTDTEVIEQMLLPFWGDAPGEAEAATPEVETAEAAPEEESVPF